MGKLTAAKPVIWLAGGFMWKKQEVRVQRMYIEVRFQRLQRGMKQFWKSSKRGCSKSGIRPRIDLNKVSFLSGKHKGRFMCFNWGEKKKPSQLKMNFIPILRPIQNASVHSWYFRNEYTKGTWSGFLDWNTFGKKSDMIWTKTMEAQTQRLPWESIPAVCSVSNL